MVGRRHCRLGFRTGVLNVLGIYKSLTAGWPIGLDTRDLGKLPMTGAAGDRMAHIDTADEWTTKFLDWQLSRAWSEDRLSMRERAIMALTSDVSQQALDETFHRHVELALDTGLGADGVRDVVRFCAEHGIASVVAALSELDNILSTAH